MEQVNWYAVAMKEKGGAPVDNVSKLSTDNYKISADPMDPTTQAPQGMADNAYSTHTYSMSRVTSPVRADIDQSFVVLDAHAVAGLSPQQMGISPRSWDCR